MATRALARHGRDRGLPAVSERRHALIERYGARQRHAVVSAPGPFCKLALSGDGGTLAGAAGNTLCLWDTASDRRVDRFVLEQPIAHVAVTENGRRLLVADADNVLHLIELGPARRCRLRAARKQITALAMDAGGATGAYATADGFIRTIDADSGRTKRRIEAGIAAERLVVSVANDVLAADREDALVLFRLSSASLEALYTEAEQDAWPGDAGIPLVSLCGPRARLFDAETGKLRRTFDVAFAPKDCTPDGTHFAAATGGDIVLWRVASATARFRLHNYVRGALDLKVAPDAERVYVCGDDATVEIYEPRHRRHRALVDVYCPIMGAVTTPEDAHLVVADQSGTVSVYDLESGRVERHRLHDGCISKLSVAGTWVATASYDGSAAVVDVATGELVHRVRNDRIPIQAVALDGHELLVTGNGLGVIEYHDLSSGRAVKEAKGNISAVRCLSVSPCRRYLLSSAENGDVLVFEYSSARILSRLSGFRLVYEACFDETGDFVFYGDMFGRINKVRSATGEIVDHWRIHRSHVRAVNARAGPLCSIGIDDDACVLDATTGEATLRAAVDAPLCRRVAFLNARGTRFVTGGQDGRLRFHDATSGAVAAELHHLGDGFLWTAAATGDGPDDGAWFWTDRPDLIEVLSRKEDSEALLEPGSSERIEYIRTHNNRLATMARVGMSERAARGGFERLTREHEAALETSAHVALLEYARS